MFKFVNDFIEKIRKNRQRVQQYNNMLDRTRYSMQSCSPEENEEDELVDVGNGIKIRKGDL